MFKVIKYVKAATDSIQYSHCNSGQKRRPEFNKMSSQMASREPTVFLSVPHALFPKTVRSGDLCFYSYIYDIVVCKFIDWIFHRIASLFSSCFYFSFVLGNPRTILNLLSNSNST